MTKVLSERVNRRGDELALADEFADFTWAEFNTRQNRLIHGLRGLGVGLGDTVGILGGNRHEWVETLSAAVVSVW